MRYLFVLILLSRGVFADEGCGTVNPSAPSALGAFGRQLESAVKVSLECAEQELLDIVLDPYRVQSVAVNLCSQDAGCMRFLRDEAARVSMLPAEGFNDLNAVGLWGEITKYAGLNRIRPPGIEDLPLNRDPAAVFESLKEERFSQRQMNRSEQLRFACSALAAIIGPGKFKAFTALNQGLKVHKIQQTHEVQKLISKNRLPLSVKEKFLKWISEVENKGLEEVRRIPGFHDEPIRSLAGRRSVRMSDGFRACYETALKDGVRVVTVITISNDHRDSGYCR